MKGRSIAMLGACATLAGCMGTHMPKLAKCTGPYRYANTYGTVLPSLPIPAQGAASPASVPAAPPSATPLDPAPDIAPPGKTSALMPHYPSC